MTGWKKNTAFLLVALTGVLVLCTVFEDEQGVANGLVMGKVWWFHRAMPLFCMAVFISFLLSGKSKFSFNPADAAMLLFFAVTHLFYNTELNPEPEKMLYERQLPVLWFMFRLAFTAYPRSRLFFTVMLLCIGAAQAITGLQQLYGLEASNHSAFRLTGSFYNPGPYSGFLAMLVPVALSLALRTGKYPALAHKVLHYFAWAVIALILIVLPAGMSRTAWLAAFAASVWLYWIQETGLRRTKAWIWSHRKLAVASAAACITLTVVLATGVFLLKKDSANGRLLLWKISARAMAEHPLEGTGMGGFPAAYAEAQAAYFASGKGTETERLVAGAPEYAFNEFLQIGVERGIIGLLVFLYWIIYCVRRGIRSGRYGAAGGIVALCLFSLASYPLQLPEFPIVLVMLAAMAVSGAKRQTGINGFYVAVPALLFSCLSFFLQKDDREFYNRWTTARYSYNSKAYDSALPRYEALYPKLKHRPEFLFELGQCQGKTGQHANAIETLQRATRLSADPMIQYMIARNEQQKGNYEAAEAILLHAVDMLPERIYPYYLLALLYNEPGFYRPEKLKQAVNAVLTKEPKVHSTAIDEMREEVKTYINIVQ